MLAHSVVPLTLVLPKATYGEVDGAGHFSDQVAFLATGAALVQGQVGVHMGRDADADGRVRPAVRAGQFHPLEPVQSNEVEPPFGEVLPQVGGAYQQGTAVVSRLLLVREDRGSVSIEPAQSAHVEAEPGRLLQQS